MSRSRLRGQRAPVLGSDARAGDRSGEAAGGSARSRSRTRPRRRRATRSGACEARRGGRPCSAGLRDRLCGPRCGSRSASAWLRVWRGRTRRGSGARRRPGQRRRWPESRQKPGGQPQPARSARRHRSGSGWWCRRPARRGNRACRTRATAHLRQTLRSEDEQHQAEKKCDVNRVVQKAHDYSQWSLAIGSTGKAKVRSVTIRGLAVARRTTGGSVVLVAPPRHVPGQALISDPALASTCTFVSWSSGRKRHYARSAAAMLPREAV